MKRKKPFYPEYMTKRQPTVPRCFCRTTLDWLLGVMSPSLAFRGGKNEEEARALTEFNNKHRKYMCWKRQLSREGWKALYRQERIRKQYPPESQVENMLQQAKQLIGSRKERGKP